jgi:tRNA (guanine10-N2)-methyltransferase
MIRLLGPVAWLMSVRFSFAENCELNQRQTTAHWGAFFFGSDIDGRQMRGKGLDNALKALICILIISAGKSPGIIVAATQYGVASKVLDLCSFDVTHNPWRCGELFDAIVTDPPCKLYLDITC